MIAVVDDGVGNLYSLTCSLRHIGAQCTVTREENALRAADRIILPGVGAFGDAAAKLHALRLDALLRDLAGQGKPDRASRSWASALACSFSLTRAMNTASTRALA